MEWLNRQMANFEWHVALYWSPVGWRFIFCSRSRGSLPCQPKDGIIFLSAVSQKPGIINTPLQMPPSTIAVLGGGITGLSAAFHLSKRFPSSRLILLEKSDRLGGWIKSKRVRFDIPGGDIGEAVVESGPRTLRPQSKALLELVRNSIFVTSTPTLLLTIY